ncbi:MAG TPA: adenosine kinase [Hyphomicrobiaceae bacterium]|jgi:sugar/nucleoside kinase (ribokinase family)|nr:MAG: adenosine kinase [Pseudomonadota bacterium]HEX5600868.1 adenosine kinase [Hyphomicrobiaceae bacterium]
MSNCQFDVVGIGNAIVDIIGQCDDDFLARHNAPKGHMRLIDFDTATRLYADMGPAIEISGGSVANTMVGIASLGGRAAFIGKVAQDEFGRIFAHDIRSAGVHFETAPSSSGLPTARSLILVTPDGERTMNTYLGVSPYLNRGEVDPEVIRAAGIVFLEGYLFDRPEAKDAFRQAAEIAAAAGRKVALSLSDKFCVDRHREEFLALVRNNIDILIANESEITALYQVEMFDDAVPLAQADTQLAVLTRSAKGSVICAHGQEPIQIQAQRVDNVVDVTGAGDLYAAGFLHGLAAGLSLEVAGRLGSLAAAEVISHFGARPQQSLAALAKAHNLI